MKTKLAVLAVLLLSAPAIAQVPPKSPALPPKIASDDSKINKDSPDFYRRLWRVQIQEVAAKDAEIADLLKKQADLLTEKAKLLEENSRLKQGAVVDAMAADDAEILKARKAEGGKVNWKDLVVEKAPATKAEEKAPEVKPAEKPKAN